MTRKKSFQTAPSVLVLKVMNMDGVKIILIKYLKFKQVLILWLKTYFDSIWKWDMLLSCEGGKDIYLNFAE